MSLPSSLAKPLSDKLSQLMGKKVFLLFKNNRSTFLRFWEDRKRQELCIILHNLFLAAPDTIVEALASHLKKRNRKDLALLRTFIEEGQEQIDYSFTLPWKKLWTQGKYFDLTSLFDNLCVEYFSGEVFEKPHLTWFSPPRYRKVRVVTFGTYDRRLKLIRVNALLDNPTVPKGFVSFILYHEMLHHLYPGERKKSGRRSIHTPFFRKKEREFRHFLAMKEWEKNFLKR